MSRLGVIHIYSFPIGLAPTTRIVAYCKGLVSLGYLVDIYPIGPQKYNSIYPKQGVCEGGNYYHFSKMPKIKIPLLTGWILILYNMIKLLKFIKREHSKCKYDAIILSFDAPWQLNIIGNYLKKNDICVIAIADEYPIPIRKYLKDTIPNSKIKKYRNAYKSIDARILMTSKLKDFYNSMICIKPTLLLSTIVDIDRFCNVNPMPNEREYLCYMGNMELSKDNVDNIIIAFNLIKDIYPSIDLYLYGAPNNRDKAYLSTLIKSLNLNGRVMLKGVAHYDDVPSILSGAKILVSSQPDTKRAEGGFPTKLGEYFMTGIPTLLTDVGEISEYVKHKQNGYLVPPSQPHLYSQTIQYIIDHYDEALYVAHNAKQYIINNYSYLAAGQKIANFIQELN